MQRILIIKTSSLGDVIHNLPVISDIKRHYPDVMIDWVVEESFADIPHLHPDVNKVITVAVRRWRKALFERNTWAEIAQFKANVQAKKYGLIIDTQGLLKSSIMASVANGIRHGYDKHSIREPIASRFYHVKHTVSRKLHAVERNRLLAAHSLNFTLENAPLEYGLSWGLSRGLSWGISSSEINTLNLPKRFVMGLHGTSRDSKLWPTEHWVAVAKLLDLQGLHLVLPWGNIAEKSRAELIAAQANNVMVLPKLAIKPLAGVIAQAEAAIGVDTGLAHLAVALNKPTVAIYVDTNPQLTGVFGVNNTAVNLGGNLKKMQLEMPTPTQVMQNLQAVLSGSL